MQKGKKKYGRPVGSLLADEVEYVQVGFLFASCIEIYIMHIGRGSTGSFFSSPRGAREEGRV